MASLAEKKRWVLDWLGNHTECSAVSKAFHDAYAKEFKVKQTSKMYGAEPCPSVMKLLKRMTDEGQLTRSTVGLPEAPAGFPNWIYSYSLNQD